MVCHSALRAEFPEHHLHFIRFAYPELLQGFPVPVHFHQIRSPALALLADGVQKQLIA
jgi:hypothetical protein